MIAARGKKIGGSEIIVWGIELSGLTVVMVNLASKDINVIRLFTAFRDSVLISKRILINFDL